MILIIRPQIELDPVNFAAESVAAWAVIRRDRRTFILADVAGLIAGVDHRDRHVQAAFAVFLAVHVQRDGTPFGQAAAVILELHAHLVFASGNRPCSLNEIYLPPREFVVVLELPIFGEGPQAFGAAPWGDEDARGARLGNLD